MMAKKELMFSITKKDFKIDYFSGKGAGGQHRNKHQNCIRLTHTDSGVTCTGQSSKERSANLREAFTSLTKDQKFKLWLNRRFYEVVEGKTIDQKVEDDMKPENIKVEYYDGGWVEEE